MSKNKFSNHLGAENSPYLLQHADNPVDWYPWGPEALEKATRENKMLLISIGYSACHWCHVMAHESYEDEEVAAIMNKYFVNIKVDREERPDIDDIYMTACQLSNGKNCGWPLNAFALPDGRPVWAGTYFPKNQWINVLKQFIHYHEKEGERLEEAATNLIKGFHQLEQLVTNADETVLSAEKIAESKDLFLKQIDWEKGGRKGAPKFPLPNNYEFLLEYHHLYNDQSSLDAVQITLENMARGGIYDQLGGGFARYAVDEDWFAPHFEKMLYDNAQLVALYSHAFQQTKNPEFQKIVEDTISFVERELSSSEGGFYSSLDADSEGVEGLFYTWTWEEVVEVISDKAHLALYTQYYNINETGNWEEGRNILYRSQNTHEFANKQGLTQVAVERIITKYNQLLLDKRSKKIRPGLDDKILTSWNALMIEGLIQAYRAFGNKKYLEQAVRSAHFITKNMMDEDMRLWRSYKAGNRKINAFLDDYATMIKALLSIYEVTFEIKWLNLAEGLSRYALKHFYDEKDNKFYYTSGLDPMLVTRKTEMNDNVIPGSVSMMTKNLVLIGHYTSDLTLIKIAENLFKRIVPTLSTVRHLSYYSNWFSVAMLMLKPPKEVVIIGDEAGKFRDEIIRHFLPDIIIVGDSEENELSLTHSRHIPGKTFVYVCENRVCQRPVESVEQALGLINA
jgi:uncharacterized protein YyaL (SSP411 family)